MLIERSTLQCSLAMRSLFSFPVVSRILELKPLLAIQAPCAYYLDTLSGGSFYFSLGGNSAAESFCNSFVPTKYLVIKFFSKAVKNSLRNQSSSVLCNLSSIY